MRGGQECRPTETIENNVTEGPLHPDPLPKGEEEEGSSSGDGGDDADFVAFFDGVSRF